MDTQIVEILGRHRLIDELLSAGVEVAEPVRDHGIALIAYVEREPFNARPLQLKVSSQRSFAIDRKYVTFANLLLVFVWNIGNDGDVEIYALTYGEALAVGEQMGWTKTKSWSDGKYVTSNPSQELVRVLQDYRIESGQWRQRLTLA